MGIFRGASCVLHQNSFLRGTNSTYLMERCHAKGFFPVTLSGQDNSRYYFSDLSYSNKHYSICQHGVSSHDCPDKSLIL